MPVLATGRSLLCALASATLACTTYGEAPSGPDAVAGSAGVEGLGGSGGEFSGGKAHGGGGAAGAVGTVGGSANSQAGAPDEGDAGAPTCVAGDCCPDDADKVDPGDCGCGVPDGDTDGDGTLDCQDDCPDDPNKSQLETCGCNLPETDTAELAACAGLKSALIHRYDFEGGGTAVQDRVGTAHGKVEGNAEQTLLDDRGVLSLVGNAAYVDLPNFLISDLTSVTLEVWVAWNGGKPWQRIFDIGESDAVPPENMQKNGKDYLFLTPQAAGSGSRFGFSLGGASVEEAISLPMALASTVSHVAAVVDTQSDKMFYYLDGTKGGEQPFTEALSVINDVNVWLGRSQYASDPAFTGTYHEFRVYDAALSPKQVATSFKAGPDATFLRP